MHAWHLRSRGRATVVFFHGNAGTIADRLTHATAWLALEFDVLLVEYPGYGRSEGEPSEASLRAAADAAHTWARAQGKRVVAFGESLGGAVAIDLAARRKLDALVVQSTFTSVADMAKALAGHVGFRSQVPPSWRRAGSSGRMPAGAGSPSRPPASR